MSAKLPPGTLEKLWSDPANWRALYFYYCKDDPRYLVPKRNKWAGWTVNFAHPAAWIRMVLGMGVTLAIAYAAVRTHRPIIVTATLLGIVVLAVVLGRWQASPTRFEERK
jgi:hypothetical protein